METREIEDKKLWEDFLLECQDKTFLQSWNWGEFNKMMGNKIWRLGFFEADKLLALATVVKTVARRGSFLLVPHGPVTNLGIRSEKDELLRLLLAELKNIAKKEKVDFIRVSPIWPREKENSLIFSRAGFRKAPIHAHPEASWKLDITPSEEELLSNMRKSTRYLIRRGLKDEDMEVKQSKEMADIDIFEGIYKRVVKKQKFVPFSEEYLKNEFKAFLLDDQISLFLTKYKGEYIAAAFVLFWSGIGFYHHAALSPQHQKTAGAYLLQWEAIKEAKKRGCTLYDFWGYVDPKQKAKHPWAGPTFFKMGFGGEAHEYVRTQDYPLSFKYWLTNIFERIRKAKRGL